MRSVKDNLKDAIWAILIGIVFFTIVFGGIFLISYNQTIQNRAREICITNGYPKVLILKGNFYCLRTVNGTDEIVPVKELIE